MMPPDTEANEAEVSGAMSDSEHEYNSDDHTPKDDDNTMADSNISTTGPIANGEVKKKYDPKDPSRPRRKKARRACYACQRAHLTCGDERPCLRCVKRSIADQCQDGVRKKAKYLHDAPAEALGPVLGPGYNGQITPAAGRANGTRHMSNTAASDASSAVGTYYSQPNSSQYQVYPATQTPIQSLPDGIPFASQQSPVSPAFQNPQNGGGQLSGSINVPDVSNMPNFGSSLFDLDPSDPAIYNFSLDGMNFGSTYGAVEFSMLEHMSGAAGTPPRDPSMSLPGSTDLGFADQNVFGGGGPFPYDANTLNGFMGLESLNGLQQQGSLQHGLPHAYAIAVRPTSLQSPSTDNNSPQATNNYEGSPTAATFASAPGAATQPFPPRSQQPRQTRQSQPSARVASNLLGKRRRDPTYIYESVKQPYPYVRGFHRLMELLVQRLPAEAYEITKSLASIRGPFISCTRTLNKDDLVFMEKTFQRTLLEYEEFMHQCSTPSIVCRRTGEVAGVNKEFTALTGWTEEVLLGHKPNLNINKGISSSASGANSGSAGQGTAQTTPMMQTENDRLAALSRTATSSSSDAPQPIFLAELLDGKSVKEFYHDFAELAFNNTRGRVTRKCRLYKYRTAESVVEGSLGGNGGNDSALAAQTEGSGNSGQSDGAQQQQQQPPKSMKQSILSNRVARIDGEHGISRLEKDGKLECSYTWVIKRDTFDIPMMIVINFLPCYYRNHDQLAV